ncbi:hypothetical protein [Stenotrophomonas rhizophila]|uniref:hypothetical protein n=1 Tax=Stenotrophomonas rhizophila TaxID=216778 RepID=UPI0028B00BE7|nr:hypothetical protein [Stenotrophomonas rhizophila]
MSKYYFSKVPSYRLDKFVAVRSSVDNLHNLLALSEIVNTCSDCMGSDSEVDFDLAIFTGSYSRAWVKKSDGYFSMAIPFQVIDDGEFLSFNIDALSEAVSGQVISVLRNSMLTWVESSHSHDEVVLSLCDSFGFGVAEATKYADAFVYLLAEDHGYFRYDDDLKNANGRVHPRHHFDFFFKNSSSVKVGLDEAASLECFLSLCDASVPKRYLR